MGYNFIQFIKDILDIRDAPCRGKYGRFVWGTDPADIGEGLAFMEAGEMLFERGKYEGEVGIDMVNIDKELMLIGRAIEAAVKKCTIEVVLPRANATTL